MGSPCSFAPSGLAFLPLLFPGLRFAAPWAVLMPRRWRYANISMTLLSRFNRHRQPWNKILYGYGSFVGVTIRQLTELCTYGQDGAQEASNSVVYFPRSFSVCQPSERCHDPRLRPS